MKKIVAVLSMVAFLSACDDSSSASAGQNDDLGIESSSSSVTLQSSSSVRSSSSAPVEDLSSSSEKEKSSSSKNEDSSSSVKSEPSSSVVTPEPSSSEIVVNSSSSLSELSSSSSEDFDWSLPKETYLNPEIEYDTIIDSRDGKVYKTVKIGDQTWMAENLNFDPGQGGSGEDKYDWSWCYNDEPANCDVAGRYYTWAAAIDSVKLVNDVNYPWDCGYLKKCLVLKGSRLRGICPTGWHLPNYYDWHTLLMVAGGTSTASKILKSRIGWSGNGNGTDAFGFSALPAGFRGNGGIYYLEGNDVSFWTSDGERDDVYDAYNMNMAYDKDKASLNLSLKYYGRPVRCVKNGADWESNWD